MVGGLLGGFAAVLAAPLTGLSATTFTVVVTVAGLGAALLGGFQSFPLTLLGGLIIGVGESMATLYGGDITRWSHQDLITGLNRVPAFLVILIVVVVGGRSLPLRSHVAERLPKLGSGEVNLRGVLVACAITLVLLFTVMNETWAQATSTSLAAAVIVLSIVVLTGYAGQISLAQWALAGIGALIAGRFVRAGVPVEIAILLGILLTIPVGLALRHPRAANAWRQPRGHHARARFHGVGGRVRESQLPRRQARRWHPHREREAVRHPGRRVQSSVCVGDREFDRVRRCSRCSSRTSAGRVPDAA